MDRASWVQSRRKRYLAQVLGEFEKKIVPSLPQNPAMIALIEEFKGITRAKMNALAVDAVDIYRADIDGETVNEFAMDLRDQRRQG